MTWVLTHFYFAFQSLGATSQLGAYGVAIVALTIVVRLVLFPLFAWQLKTSRRSMTDQKKVAPELAKLRKKYKGNPQQLNAEMMKLYKEHGINPMAPLMGCLPLLVQMPVLYALYYVLRNEAYSRKPPFHLATAHFLWIPSLNITPGQVSVLSHLAVPHMLAVLVPTPTYLIIPLLAGVTTFIQSKMMMPPVNPDATPEEQQAQQLSRNMQWLTPIMIYYFAVVTPAGLGLYWLVSNVISIIQQYFVLGWGGLARPSPAVLALGSETTRTESSPRRSDTGNGRSSRDPGLASRRASTGGRRRR